MTSLIRTYRRVRTIARDWYYRRTDAFKAAWTTAWIAFMARVAVPIITLSDDLANWIDGSGAAITRDQLIGTGRALAGAGYGLVAFGLNYLFRTYRPNAVYLTGAGSTIRQKKS